MTNTMGTTPFISIAEQKAIITNATIAASRFAKEYSSKIGLDHLFTEEDIEDIAGNTIYKACRSFAAFDAAKGKLSTWVSRIAVNCVINAVDYKIKHLPISAELYVENPENGEEYEADEVCDERKGFNPEVWDMLSEYDCERSLNQKEFEACIRAQCTKLSAKNMRYEHWLEEGYAPKDMAAEDGCTANAAAKRVFAIRQALRGPVEEIADEFGIPFKKKMAC